MGLVSKLLLVFFIALSNFSIQASPQYIITSSNRLNALQISQSLATKGYNAMSMILEMTLDSLVPPELVQVTIFCPSDEAFLSSKYSQPPFTLLQYHVASSKLNKEVLLESSRMGSKIETLLPGHPLVVTTLPGGVHASINQVKIKDWNLYNDGQVIVHGVHDFFDPAFQTLLYPQFDGGVLKSHGGPEKTRLY